MTITVSCHALMTEWQVHLDRSVGADQCETLVAELDLHGETTYKLPAP
jgi:hypothetical protein